MRRRLHDGEVEYDPDTGERRDVRPKGMLDGAQWSPFEVAAMPIAGVWPGEGERPAFNKIADVEPAQPKRSFLTWATERSSVQMQRYRCGIV